MMNCWLESLKNLLSIDIQWSLSVMASVGTSDVERRIFTIPLLSCFNTPFLHRLTSCTGWDQDIWPLWRGTCRFIATGHEQQKVAIKAKERYDYSLICCHTSLSSYESLTNPLFSTLKQLEISKNFQRTNY